MIWYLLHNSLKVLFPNMEPQHRNLTTFLIGTVLYTLFYSYVGTLGREHTFLNVFFKYSIYILMADAFAMANLYKHTIFREVEETIGSRQTLKPIYLSEEYPKSVNIENAEIMEEQKQDVPQIEDNTATVYDDMEGFVKDSALGDHFTTTIN